MNIYDPYPDHVVVDGKRYRINTSYDRFLRAVDVHDMSDLTSADKLELQCRLLLATKRIPKDPVIQSAIVQAVFDMLPKNKGSDNGEKYMDLHQDAPLIRSAFMRIGIDLSRDPIHFLQFFELLGDLPSDTALMRVIDIRRRKVPQLTKYNQEEVHWLQEAKARVALDLTDEERHKQFAAALRNSAVLRG